MKVLINIIITILMLITNSCFAETPKETVMALKYLEAKTQVGIIYKDYLSALGDAKFAVNQFIESKESDGNPEFKEAILMTMKHFEFAQFIWSSKFAYASVTERLGSQGKVGLVLMKNYPNANKFKSEGGILIKENTTDFFGMPKDYASKPFVIDDAVKFVWNEASKSLALATELMNKQEQEIKSALGFCCAGF